MYFTIGVGIWAIVMLFLLGKLIYRTIELNKSVTAFIDKNICLRDLLTEYADNKKINKIDVAIVPDNISPFITGIFHPVMVLPQFCMDINKLEDVICHEIEHYLNNDLYVDSKYICTFQQIPEDFKNIEVQ